MDIIKLQIEIFGEENKDKFFTSLTEVKNSITKPEISGRTLLIELLDNQSLLPLFNPISISEMKNIIKNSDVTAQDSNGDNALLIALNHNLEVTIIESLLSVSNMSQKNKNGVNALTLAVQNQSKLPTNILLDIHNSRSESFTLTRRNLSSDFYTANHLDKDLLQAKYLKFKRKLESYNKGLKELQKTHQSVFKNG